MFGMIMFVVLIFESNYLATTMKNINLQIG